MSAADDVRAQLDEARGLLDGGASTAFAVAEVAVDPLAALVTWGLGWVVELTPMREILDAVVGDPAELAAQAAAWRETVAGGVGVALEDSVPARNAIGASWSGEAADAFAAAAAEIFDSLDGFRAAARHAETLLLVAGQWVTAARQELLDVAGEWAARVIANYATSQINAAWTGGVSAAVFVQSATADTLITYARMQARVGELRQAFASLVLALRRIGETVGRLSVPIGGALTPGVLRGAVALPLGVAVDTLARPMNHAPTAVDAAAVLADGLDPDSFRSDAQRTGEAAVYGPDDWG